MMPTPPFPMVSVRNPWGFLIQRGFKRIENRKKDLPKEFWNRWIALHVSKTFAATEQKYARTYLARHSELLESDSGDYSTPMSGLSRFRGFSLQPNNHSKLGYLISNQLNDQTGKIIAFFKISRCVNSFAGKQIDPIYSDAPYIAQSHWVIADVIPLPPNQYIKARGHMGCAYIKNNWVNTQCQQALNELLAQRELNKTTKISKISAITKSNANIDGKEKEEESTDSADNMISETDLIEDDDDIVHLLDGLDNGTQFSQSTISKRAECMKRDSISSDTKAMDSNHNASRNLSGIGTKRKYQESSPKHSSHSPPIKKVRVSSLDALPSPSGRILDPEELNKLCEYPSDDDEYEDVTSFSVSNPTDIKPLNQAIDGSKCANSSKSKRKLPSFVSGSTASRLSPSRNRLDWTKNRNMKPIDNTASKQTDCKFEKLSRKKTLYDLKHNENKIDLMIPSTSSMTNEEMMNLNDIEAELEIAVKQQSPTKSDNAHSKAVHDRIYNNPLEQRRKAHDKLPDMKRHRVIVFDTETACFKPFGVIIDIGAVELINGKFTGRSFQSYIKPWSAIHPQAMKVHGITERFLNENADGDIYDVIQSFMEWITADCICAQCRALKPHEMEKRHQMKLVGHNVQFDLRHLNGAIDHCQSKKGSKRWEKVDIQSTFDTMDYFRRILGNACCSLDDMCRKYGVRNDARKLAHGAMVDAKLTAKCLQKMWSEEIEVAERKCTNRLFRKKL